MLRVSIVLLVSCFLLVPAHAEETPKLKALLILGGCCHDYKTQKDILKKGLEERANVEVTIAHDPDTTTKHKNPVYENPDWAKGFDVIIHDECSADVKDLAVIETILKPHKEGVPAVHLHCSMHSYRSAGFPKNTPWFEFTGLATTGHGPQLPIEINFVDKEHAITKTLQNWTTGNEELYNNTTGKLYDTAAPLARGKQVVKSKDGKENPVETIVAWVNTYNEKTRVFGTTIGHNNATVQDPRYLDMVTRGMLWSCDKLNDKYLKPAR
ncbi:MAG TPA: ThuA domain-containing protein [Planctomycetota bacterium]|nr:ThuA domain-containing protein [Planctomycetota bacterium]